MARINQGLKEFLAWRQSHRRSHWASFRADPARWLGKVDGQLNRNEVARELGFKHHRRLTQNEYIRAALERLERYLYAKGILTVKTRSETPPGGSEGVRNESGDQRLIKMLQAENERLRAQLQRDGLQTKCLIMLGELLDD